MEDNKPNYGGNSFPFRNYEPVKADRLPIWVSIEERKSAGAALTPSATNPVGTKWPLGTPIQFDPIGGTPVLGASATTPDGLLETDVVMGEQGCTFSCVTRGKIRASLVQAAITASQKEYLKDRILFENEYVESV